MIVVKKYKKYNKALELAAQALCYFNMVLTIEELIMK